MKLALLLPGYLDSPEYLHLKIFDKRLSELGYTVERLDLGGLWETGDVDNYKVSNFIKQIKDKIDSYKNQNPEEIVLIGHSRGGFTAIIAGSKLSEVTRIVALCPPPDVKSAAFKWINKEPRVSRRELPENPDKFRDFSIPYSFVEDALQYSAVEEVKNINKPLMIFIGLADTVVEPKLTEQIVANANNPYVIRQKGMGHDFRFSEDESNLVMDEIEKFLVHN